MLPSAPHRQPVGAEEEGGRPKCTEREGGPAGQGPWRSPEGLATSPPCFHSVTFRGQSLHPPPMNPGPLSCSDQQNSVQGCPRGIWASP